MTRTRMRSGAVVIFGVSATLVAATATSPALAGAAAHASKPAKPVVTSVTYKGFASGSTKGGGRVTIGGKHLHNVKSVKFGHVPGSHVKVVSATKLTVTAPRHAIDEVHVRVRTTAGTSAATSENVYDYQAHRVLDGGVNSCQVMSSRTVRCWGYNGDGELGNGTTTESHTPVPVSGLTNVVSVATGDDQSCALRASGSVYCWGGNTFGELGDGTTVASPTPMKVVGLGAKALDIAAGSDETCAVVVGNHAKCWGIGVNGQLGNGSTTTSSPTPVGVVDLSSVVDIDAGGSFACATRSNGTEYCWGYNADGELGNGTTDQSATPVRVTGVDKAVATATGESTSCVLTRTGGVRCWGKNDNGQLGDGTTDNSSSPVTVSGITGATSLAFGSLQGCVLISGRERCWGLNNYGQVGNGTMTNADTPVAVSGLKHVTAIGAAAGHSLATVKSGATKAWGQNNYGQLGDGTTTDSDVPVTVG